MSRTRILIMHPDQSVRGLLVSMLQTLGYAIDEAVSDRAAVRMLEQAPVALVIAGTCPDEPDSLEFLSYVRRKHARTPVILLFSTPHPERHREAVQWGAASVLRFPLPATSLRAAVTQALGDPEPGRGSVTPVAPGRLAHPNGNGSHPDPENGPLLEASRSEVVERQAEAVTIAPPPSSNWTAPQTGPWASMVGDDATLRQALELAASIAPTAAPVLIVGEPGTGKTLLARTLHSRSPMRAGPFVEVDCSAHTETQLETELFGRRGERPGKLVEAQGGTLVIDEVATLTPALQYRLLRAVQDSEFEPVGTSQTCRIDTRFVVSTREDLTTLVERGQFRHDLFYRLSVVTLHLPPLRHRGEDIERLAEHFRARSAQVLNKDVAAYSPEALAMLRRHTWPGNVAELSHVVQRAVVLCRGGVIEPAHLDLHRRDGSGHRLGRGGRGARMGAHIQPLKEALEGPERQLILQALEALNWNRQETARVLDINRTTLYKKMKKYGLLFDEPAWVN